MSESKDAWNVIDNENAVLTHCYEFSKGATATTFVARMGNGELLVVSPSVGLTDALCISLCEYGEVGAIVANNGFHHLGLREWMERFPGARVFAPADSRDRIVKKVPHSKNIIEPLNELASIAGEHIGYREVPDTKIGESWYWVPIEHGYAWYVSDILINLPKLPDKLFPRILFKLSGSAPGFRVFKLMLKMSVRNRGASLNLLLDDMTKFPPSVLVPAHGAILAGENILASARSTIERSL